MSEKFGQDSVDSQIDQYLNDYEVEAKSLKEEGRDWNRTLRRLFEADEEGEEGEEGEEPPSGTLDEIDVGSFTNSVVRLIDNYDSLLEIRNTILRRASNFLNKNYKSEVVDAFQEHLRNEHGMEIGKSSDELDAERFIAPISDRAGAGGGGGG